MAVDVWIQESYFHGCYVSNARPIQSTDHELIPATNTSIVAMEGSARDVMFVTIRENICPSTKEINKDATMFIIKITLQWLR
jgi:hypothetical protein